MWETLISAIDNYEFEETIPTYCTSGILTEVWLSNGRIQ